MLKDKFPIDFYKLIIYNHNVNKLMRGIVLVLLLALTFSLRNERTSAQVESQRYFQETGHWVTGDFYTTYMSVPDPEAIFGYPITDAFQDQTTRAIVQYFERAHFKLHPENPPEMRIEITMLGEMFYKPGETLPIPSNFPACKTYPETGHQVCYAFLSYFENNGGVALFGYPISDIEIHNKRMVQYFQRALFEWHPELETGKKVALSDLGWQYFFSRHEDPNRLKGNADSYSLQTVLNLKVRAFVSKAVVGSQSSQSLYAVVLDQKLFPVQNAQVIATIRYPSGKENRIVMPLTDANGVSKLPFTLNESDRGIVQVLVNASYDLIQQDTRTSFRIWW